MSYGTGPGIPPYGPGGWGTQPPSGGYGGHGYPPQAGGYPPGGGGYGLPPQPPPRPPRPHSSGVTASAAVAAVLNGVVLFPLLFVLPPFAMGPLAGLVLGIVGAAMNVSRPGAGKVMMILSWVAFGLVILAAIAIPLIGLAFLTEEVG